MKAHGKHPRRSSRRRREPTLLREIPPHLIRDGLPALALVGAFACFVAGAWLTHHPNALVWDVLETTPGIGESLARLREGFRPPPPEGLHQPEPSASEPTIDEPPTVVTVGERPPWNGPREYVWVLDDVPLHREASDDSPVVFRTEAISNLPRLERRGDWFRVWRHGLEGWVHLPGYRDDDTPPYGEAVDPPGPLAPRPADEAAVTAVRELMGDRGHRGRVGPYTLWTDLDPSANLLRVLDRVAEQIDSTYTARYGRQPLGTPIGTVAVFADIETYRRFQRDTFGIEGLDAVGHAHGGLAALYVGDRRRHAIVSTLIHELVHLVNRRAIGPALPPWLDEGLCEDLANSEVTLDGDVDPARLGGAQIDWGDYKSMEGAGASLWALREAQTAGRLPSIATVVGLDWQDFVVSERSRLHYDVSSFFVRFLLDPRTPERAVALRDFLDSVADGEPPDPEALRQRLGTPWETLDAELGRWILEQARQFESPSL
ncbi:MAG: hypothetical protein AAGE94_05695 [Acidobacteriota bacterium]